MREGRLLALIGYALAAILLVNLTACSTGPSDEERKAQEAQEAWTLIEQAKADLDAKRGEIRTLTEQIAAGVEESAEEGAETAESLQAKASELEEMVATGSEGLTGMLIDFINSQGIEVGAELTDIQTAAIRMKSDEEIVIAHEYIDKAGDYTRAIDIFETALVFDPENERLKEELAKAQVDRFMNKERFGQVKKKMMQPEVRALLGQVKPQLNRAYEEDNTEAWFYEKEDGGAAGVFFRETSKGNGEWAVYHVDWDSIKAKDDGAS